MSSRFAVLVFSLCAVLTELATPLLYGQTGAGSIQGTITDTTGAVIPNAPVSALRLDTGRRFDTSTNGSGIYSFPSLDPGGYSVRVTAPGMQKWEGQVQLVTGQRAVVDVPLSVGTTATEVIVAGNVTPLVETVSSTVGAVVENQRIQQLPLNGRNIAAMLLYTVPGLDEGSGSANRSSADTPRVFGLKWGAVEFLQDGASMMNRNWGWVQMRPPGLDTVQEVRVESNNSSAKFDRPATAIITTKNGTNEFHGSLFETARNNGLAYARTRQDYASTPPPLIRNEFGASMGGPIILPKVYNGRDRSFFFGAFEAFRRRQTTTVGTRLPNEAMRQGDYSGLIDGSGQRLTIYDPLTTNSTTYQRLPFPDNKIPVNRRSALADHLYDIFPLPSMPSVNPLVSNNYFWKKPSDRDDYTGTMRLDHRLSDSDQVFVRYTEGVVDSRQGTGYNDAPITLDQTANFVAVHVVNRSVAGSWVRSFSPTLFSETLVNYSIEDWAQVPGDRSQNYAAKLGLPNPFNENGFPEIRNTGFSGLDTGENQNTQKNLTRTWKFDENLTKIWGRHELQFGGRARLELLHSTPQLQYVQGLSYFSSGATALYDPKSGSQNAAVPRTGFDGANLFLGAAGSYSVNLARGYEDFASREYSGYFQDNIKVTPRLTLNLGLRIEAYPVATESRNLMTSFNPATKAVVVGQPIDKLIAMGVTTQGIIDMYSSIGATFETPEQAGLPHSMLRSDRFNYGPRLGLAYKLTGGNHPVVIRGGFSKYAFTIPLRYYEQRSRNNIPYAARFAQDYSQAAQSPDGKTNYMLRAAPPYIAGVGTANLLDPNNPIPVSRGSFGITYMEPYQPASRAEEWNATLEREVFPNTLARVSWVGTRGTSLDQLYDTNQAPSSYVWMKNTGTALPQGTYSGVARRLWPTAPYGTIEVYRKSGHSFNNSLVLQLERRFSQGMAFQAFYTLSNAMRLAANGWYDDFAVDTNMFIAGSVPTDPEKLNRFLNYHRDSEIPKHRIRWNWVVDLPFGRGKWLGRNSGGVLDRLIGGWQFAGSGNIVSRYFSLPTNNWGQTGDINVYGLDQPVQDCRSGKCYAGYLYYNGFIAPGVINSNAANGKPSGVMGVPTGYKPSSTPLNMDPTSAYYLTNNTPVTLANGTTQVVGFDSGLHPYRNQFVAGPMLWSMNASLFKSIAVTERFKARLNADFFNVFNQPGLNLPDSGTGIISTQNSAQAPRQLQLTLRLMW